MIFKTMSSTPIMDAVEKELIEKGIISKEGKYPIIHEFRNKEFRRVRRGVKNEK